MALKPSWLWAIARATVMSVIPRSVSACSCKDWPDSFPRAKDSVPRNAKLWLGITDGNRLTVAREGNETALADERARLGRDIREYFVLHGPENAPVPFEVNDLPLGRFGLYYLVAPRQELQVGPHVFRARDAIPRDLQVRIMFSELPFTVRDERLTEPPKPPAARLEKWFREEQDRCSPSHAAVLRVEARGPFLAYQIHDLRKPPPESAEYAEADGAFWIGHGGCVPEWDFASGPALVRFGSFDIVGRFSGWGPPLRLDPPPGVGRIWRPSHFRIEQSPRGCGCGIPRPVDRGVTSILLGVILLLHRRRCTR